jgi:hypothetical protein
MPAGEVPKSIKASLYIDGQPAANSIKNVSIVAQGLRRDLSTLVVGTNEWIAKSAELQNVNKYLSTIKAEAAGVGNAFAQVSEEIAHIAEGAAIGTLAANLVRGVFESIKSFWDGSEKAYEEATIVQTALINKLEQTGGVAGETREQLIQYQKSLQEQTGVDDDVIAKGEDVLLSFTQIRGYIYSQSIPAITNLAAAQNNGKVTMESMSSAAELLGKALDKPTQAKKTLRQIGIDLTDQQQIEIKSLNDQNKLQQAQQIILDEVNKRYGNLAATLASTDVGAMQRFQTRIGNIQEVLGGLITSLKGGLATAFDPFLKWIESATETQFTETLENERVELDKLVFQITDANEKGEDRAKLIDKLKSMYPEYLSDLDREKSSNEQITAAGEKMNEMYINRIILAQKDADIDKQNQNAADLRIKQLKAEEDVRTQLVKLHDKWPDWKEFDIKGSSIDKLTAVVQKYKEMQDNAGSTTGGVFDPTFNAGKAINEYKSYLSAADNATKQSDVMLQKRNELMNQLGIAPTFKGVASNKPKVVAPQSGPTAEETAAAARKAEARKKAQAEFLADAQNIQDKVKEFNAAELADTLSKDDKEVASTKIKYDKMIAELEAFITKGKQNKNADPKEIKKAEEDVAQLKINKNKEVADLIAQQQQDLNDKIKKFQEEQTGTLGTELDKQTAKINAFYDAQAKGLRSGDINGAIQILVNRYLDLGAAALKEQQDLSNETEQLQEQTEQFTDNTDTNRLAKIKAKYDKERAALKAKYSTQLQMTKEFQKAMGVIQKLQDDEEAAEKKAQTKAYENQAIDSAKDIADGIFTINQNNRKADTDAQVQKLEDQKNTELANTDLTEDQKADINAKYAKQEADIKLAAWKADQKAAEEQAVIDGALAILKALASSISPYNFILAAGVAIATGVQIATISAQKPPQFAIGGLTSQDPAGYVGQPTLFKNSASGRPFVAGEAGTEWIAPNWMVKSPRYANIIGMLEGARQDKRTFASGGFNGSSSAAPSAGFDTRRIDRIELALHSFITEQRKVNAKPVVFSNKVYDDQKAKLVQIANNANAK